MGCSRRADLTPSSQGRIVHREPSHTRCEREALDPVFAIAMRRLPGILKTPAGGSPALLDPKNAFAAKTRHEFFGFVPRPPEPCLPTRGRSTLRHDPEEPVLRRLRGGPAPCRDRGQAVLVRGGRRRNAASTGGSGAAATSSSRWSRRSREGPRAFAGLLRQVRQARRRPGSTGHGRRSSRSRCRSP
jgi:hypothetical protein